LCSNHNKCNHKCNNHNNIKIAIIFFLTASNNRNNRNNRNNSVQMPNLC